MSWSDETRCLHCDGKLPLYRKLTNGQFCSSAHSRAYWQEQERLAVERLHQTHDSLRAYRPPGALEAILGSNAASNAEINPYYIGEELPQPVLAAESVARRLAPVAAASTFAEEIARHASNFDKVAQPGFLHYDHPEACVCRDLVNLSEAVEAVWTPFTPCVPSSENAAPAVRISMAGPVKWAEIGMATFSRDVSILASAIEQAVAPSPLLGLKFPASPVTPEFETVTHPAEEVAVEVHLAELAELIKEETNSPQDETYPEMHGMLALPRIAAPAPSADIASAMGAGAEPIAAHLAARLLRLDASVVQTSSIQHRQAWNETHAKNSRMLALPNIAGCNSAECNSPARNTSATLLERIEPLAANLPVYFPRCRANVGNAFAERLSVPGMRQLSVGQAQDLSDGVLHNAATAQSISLTSGVGAPVLAVSSDPIPLRGRLAGGHRYPVASRNGGSLALKASVVPAANESLTIELPCEGGTPIVQPTTAWLLPVPFDTDSPSAPAAFELQRGSLTRIDLDGQAPTVPASRLEPSDGALEPLSKMGFLSAAARNAAGALEPSFVWTHAVDFWKNAPRDLKLLVFAIPALLGLAMHPSLPKFTVTPSANAASEAPSAFKSAMNEQFLKVRQTVASRAGVELNEDFRAGLDSWQTRGDLSAAWSFDSNGFVRPGSLALYQPSMNLTDYDMEFLGLIDKKALNFVARAKDFDNYYVVKLVVLKPGPLPTLGVTRYAVIDGKPQNRHDVVVPINARADMLYRVSLDVNADTFLLSMQGTIVDSWSEPRLSHGGVGFFAARGEESRLRWVQVTHQYDMLGRLCAYLAPYNIPTTNGSW